MWSGRGVTLNSAAPVGRKGKDCCTQRARERGGRAQSGPAEPLFWGSSLGPKAGSLSPRGWEQLHLDTGLLPGRLRRAWSSLLERWVGELSVAVQKDRERGKAISLHPGEQMWS